MPNKLYLSGDKCVLKLIIQSILHYVRTRTYIYDMPVCNMMWGNFCPDT